MSAYEFYYVIKDVEHIVRWAVIIMVAIIVMAYSDSEY